jgi:hypothetical protein
MLGLAKFARPVGDDVRPAQRAASQLPSPSGFAMLGIRTMNGERAGIDELHQHGPVASGRLTETVGRLLTVEGWRGADGAPLEG